MPGAGRQAEFMGNGAGRGVNPEAGGWAWSGLRLATPTQLEPVAALDGARARVPASPIQPPLVPIAGQADPRGQPLRTGTLAQQVAEYSLRGL